MLTLARSTPKSERHEGLSQFIVDLDSPGVTIRPILLLNGEHHFNEVVLDDVAVPEAMVLGEPGQGWRQVTSELADERSGPERYMSTLPMVLEYARSEADPDVVGRLAAQLWSVRALSREVAGLVDRGTAPALEAALAKDVGTEFEHLSIEAVRGANGRPAPGSELERMLDSAVSHSPGFTLRGGTTEILRSVISKKLGL
jgi:alkylation response protein AidB-like acyl-CoA dehydrogenase